MTDSTNGNAGCCDNPEMFWVKHALYDVAIRCKNCKFMTEVTEIDD